ncbi:hypothetical protein LTR37_011292 [Vermiconidia calcicola]|uniref:Uncharacterized protein n=1 Tax=Vermiconidia calcicola TaxID=1690605 RepID=A0ACC3N416_9PEZI|nr:hypothetical protein LTR37_011292 [Vermiconidia calcicola]
MAAMHNDEKPEAFRFLDLPAELRNRIYEDYFGHHSHDESELDLLQIRSHLPPSKITAVCNQIHNESQGLYEHVRADFLRANRFCLGTEWHMVDKELLQKATLRKVDQLPLALKLHKLNFRNVGRKHHWTDIVRVKAEVTTGGRIDWRVLYPPSIEYSATGLQWCHDRMIAGLRAKTEWLMRRASNTGSSTLGKEGASLGLNLPLCVEAIYACT